jgi:YHS domain-containing protein
MKRLAILIILLIVARATVYSQPADNSKHFNLDDDKVAIDGYDPVSYFTDKKAVKGKASIAAESDGVQYYFSTKANKDRFLGSPSSYKPQYGGWCAYAMGAKGEKVEVDPETFKIVDGKLYLFYNRFFNNTLETWNKNESSLKANADRNWAKVVKP